MIAPQVFPSPCVSQDQSTGATVTHQSDGGIDLRDYAAVHMDLNEEDVSVSRAYTLMGCRPPDCAANPEAALQYWLDAEARYRYLRADAMLRAREWRPA